MTGLGPRATMVCKDWLVDIAGLLTTVLAGMLCVALAARPARAGVGFGGAWYEFCGVILGREKANNAPRKAALWEALDLVASSDTFKPESLTLVIDNQSQYSQQEK